MQGPETRPTLIGKLADPACEQAWNEFARLYCDIIYRVARASGLQDADAEDVTQEVFGIVSRKIKSFDCSTAGSFRGWLRKLARDVAVDDRTDGPATLGQDHTFFGPTKLPTHDSSAAVADASTRTQSESSRPRSSLAEVDAPSEALSETLLRLKVELQTSLLQLGREHPQVKELEARIVAAQSVLEAARAGGEQNTITVFQLKYAEARTTGRIIEQLTARAEDHSTSVVDERTNSIIVRGNRDAVREVTDLLNLLDVPDAKSVETGID